MKSGTRLGSLTVAMLVLMSVFSTGVVLAGGQLSYDSGEAPNPYVKGNVSVAEYHMQWSSPLNYENDNGELDKLPATVNGTYEDPYSVIASDINESSYKQFPRKSAEDGENEASFLDASEWTTDASGTSGSLSVTDVTTASGVDAVELSTSSQGAGDTAKFEYSNFSITSDVEKRYVRTVVDVNTLEAAANVKVEIHDADADYVVGTIDPDRFEASETNHTVIANSTGEGDVWQEQIGNLTVYGSGDGTMSEIQKVQVQVSEGDATIDVAAFDAESKSEWVFGETKRGSDDTKVQRLEPHGRYDFYALSSMGGSFDDARLHDLEYPAQFWASELTASDVATNFSDAGQYPGFDRVADIQYRIEVPAQFDLSYTGLELQTTTKWPGGRYIEVRYKEAAGDTDFEDISGWTDKTSSFDSEGKKFDIDATVGSGDALALDYSLKLTQSEADAMRATGGGGGGGGLFGGGGDGGIIGGIPIIGELAAALAGLFGLGKMSGGS